MQGLEQLIATSGETALSGWNAHRTGGLGSAQGCWIGSREVRLRRKLQAYHPWGTYGENMADEKQTEGLLKLRAAFEPHHISKLPKPTKKQTEDVRADYQKGMRCTVCGTWHNKDV